MATVSEIKARMLEKLASVDLDKMTLADANQYVDILRKLAEMNEKSYTETLTDMLSAGFNGCRAGYEPFKLGMAVGGAPDVQ